MGSKWQKADTLDGEVWKPVTDYEGLYEVSNFGRIKSLCAGRWNAVIIRKPVSDMQGYQVVTLRKNGFAQTITIHRLVAKAFLDNPNEWPEVNHKDEDKTNNHVENLEWCTRKYNQNYNEHQKAYYKPVIQLTDDGCFIKEYESIKAACKATGIHPSSISGVLSGRRERTGGFRWRYAR